VLALHGEWRLARLAHLQAAFDALPPDALAQGAVVVDGRGLTGIDTAGALLLWRAVQAAGATPGHCLLQAFDPRHERRELMAQLRQTCVTAIPVVVLVTFLIGVVVAYLLGSAGRAVRRQHLRGRRGRLAWCASSRRCWWPRSSPAAPARRSPPSSAR
jgi:hypothetical protein